MAVVTVDELTKGEIEGTGVFDELMRSVKAHLQEELSNERITEVNYANVYLGAMTGVMKMSTDFLFIKDKTDVEVKLAEQQRANLQVENALLEQKLELGRYALQNAKYEECTLKAQLAAAEASVQATLQSTANAKTQAKVLVGQHDKLQTEILLYKQRIRTEQAQIHDLIDGVPVTGILGTQREMFRKQANGYLRHAEQQAARIFSDIFTVRFTEDTTSATPDDNYCGGAQVTAALSALLAGVALGENEHDGKDATPVGTMPPINMAPSFSPEEPSAPASCSVTAIDV